ncbi:salicylate carboxymethyltransferase-like isoform X2 [Momordica charantia]|uniref:Salicylate carboxymethyltransferase-like isoform X2 n=1 Tax=Momordica charantia TaxID=3673 RepID=A0A6J1CRL0_MOMCH|nr:salicylate carboxymethyltransferase-like isoform X2 [Momordica charantia]
MGCRVLSIPDFFPLSVHFFHSSNSLYWLSQVPKGMENNKGNIFMGSTSSRSVLEANYRQFGKDFSMFLRCRAEELVVGGRMVLTIPGRTMEDPSNKECNYVWGFLNSALNISMVVEEILEEEKVNSFNVPSYMLSVLELKVEVLTEGSFTINHVEVSRIDWSFYDIVDNGYDFVKYVRSVVEPLLIHHFREAIIDELFCRYRKIVADHISKEKIESVNLTVSLTKINGEN